MKNLLVILILSFSFSIKSQVWISKGAIWHYEWSGIRGGGFVKIEYEKDTLVKGKLCNKLVPTEYDFITNQKNEIIPSGKYPLKNQYTYVNGDTVFYLVNDKFFILYNFGAKPGDTWNIGVDTNTFKCSKSYVKVDSVGKMTINSLDYRWIALSTMPNSSAGLRGKIVERFGAINNYLFPLDRNCDKDLVADFNDYSFNCFQDNDFKLYNVINKECEYLLKVSINDLKETLDIYPIPTSGKIFIKKGNNTELNVRIFTISGNEIYSTTKVNEIDLSNFSDGIYFIRIIDKFGNSTMRKILKTK